MILRHVIMSSVVVAVAVVSPVSADADKPARPNFIVINCDNLGYGDVGCFGSKKHRTPHIDRMAAEGLRLTSFYVSAGVCTPSRASLMTACYPRRVGLHWNRHDGWVLRPASPTGLHPDEVTVAKVLKPRGYATACIGKWHLGDQTAFLPTRQGFDEYFGIPYSDNMVGNKRPGWPPLPLMRDEKVIEAPVERNDLTKRYTLEAVRFIEAHRDKPFFLYLPHAMPGSTRAPFASERFRGKSANGPYGDSVEELDWSMGEILAALKRLGIDEQTLVVWTSDNGAPRHNPPQGSNLPWKGWGYNTSEGAMRMPCIIRWPGQTPAGTVCDELMTSMDLMPTFARLTGAKMPTDRIIDGRDVSDLLLGKPDAKSPHEVFYYYHARQLQAVRDRRYKLYLALEKKLTGSGDQGNSSQARLYDLVTDPRETRNLAQAKPQVVSRLMTSAQRAREDLGDLNRPGKNQRPAGKVENPKPQLIGG